MLEFIFFITQQSYGNREHSVARPNSLFSEGVYSFISIKKNPAICLQQLEIYSNATPDLEYSVVRLSLHLSFNFISLGERQVILLLVLTM